MEFNFTAAAERAIVRAAGWSDCNDLDAVALLAGLLAESECRAAAMLNHVGVEIAVVRRQWPELACEPSSGPPRRPIRFSFEVESSLRTASQRLALLPKPLELATEHVLLGLVATDLDVGVWLRQHGLDPDRIEAEIYRRNGVENGGAWRVESGEARAASRATAGLSSSAEKMAEQAEPGADVAVLRLLDAAANRAREGLRVVEDYVRFVLDDRHLTELCKRLRHDLAAALSPLPWDRLLASRETRADVGTPLSTASELRREDAAEVLRANFARLEESLRSLEEFGKLTGDAAAGLSSSASDPCGGFKPLRYRVYTLERAVEITRGNRQRLAAARLYVLIDGGKSEGQFERLARSLIDAGVDALQLRDKRLGDRELLARARRLRALTDGTATLFVMNDRPDLAALARADGVHIGQEELSVKDARSMVGPGALVGVSTHTIEQARQAVLDGADYIGVGPVFPSKTKSFDRLAGVALLRAVAEEIALPAFAIGGISAENLDEVLAAGFARVAVGAAVSEADDPAEAARMLKARMTKDEGRMSKE